MNAPKWRLKSNTVYYAGEFGDATLLPTSGVHMVGDVPNTPPLDVMPVARLLSADNDNGNERRALVAFLSGQVPVLQLRLTRKGAECLSKWLGSLAESMEPEKVETEKVIVPGA